MPLIVLTIGSRIEEILLLKRRSLRLRNGTYCLAINVGSEVEGKTADAERFIPIPQILIDLGFVPRIQNLEDDHGPLLFPEAAARTSIEDIRGPFSKALNRILTTLNLGDFDADFYALRKTLSSILRAADVTDGQRDAIAGHRGCSILRLHYTAHHARDLKAAIDKADFKLEIVFGERHGFPVIRSCGMAPATSFDVVLAEDGEAASICVIDHARGVPVFEFSRSDMAGEVQSSRSALRKAPAEFRDIVGDGHLRLPRSPLKRAAVESLHALV